MAAIGECALLGHEKHVNDRWIKVMKMEHMAKAFIPICPKKSCCNVTEMVSTALLCPGGGIATPVCNGACVWKYDCTNKTVVETPSVSGVAQIPIPQVASAWSDDGITESDEEFSAVGDSQSFEDQLALEDYILQFQPDEAIGPGNSAYFPEDVSARDTNPAIPTVLGLVVGLVVIGIIVLVVFLFRMRSENQREETN